MLNEIFQFVPANGAGFERLLKKIPAQKVSMIFDLEDGIQDVIYPERTQHLKQKSRIELLSFFRRQKLFGRTDKTGFRINSIRGDEFEFDLKFLKEVSLIFSFHYLVLPKLNSAQELIEYRIAFSENNILFSELIPIIETTEGFGNLDELISDPPGDRFHRAFWGHHDYNLDGQVFPFAEHRSKQYWELTECIISKLESAGYGYINGAFLELNNDSFLEKIVSGVFALCKMDFDVVALSYSQVKLFLSLQSLQPLQYGQLVGENNLSEDERISLAEKTIRQFLKNQLSEKSFSVDREEAIIISPQQYLGAVKFLSQYVPAHD